MAASGPIFEVIFFKSAPTGDDDWEKKMILKCVSLYIIFSRNGGFVKRSLNLKKYCMLFIWKCYKEATAKFKVVKQ